ncbi:cytochrome c oxidase subunit II [Citreimonas salinaria]|uniref:Cytochrome c oxidase subunit 2 n=1 Tax=Citreimonas salinaria TaxID=321339 RepID=A0A1H3M401_9RHOB|nr:c-type cytochrome [Citreimonas salinaria]SDY71431.1 cytochrome c oxidase subunit 2 [Citreimonas salinaria]
MILSAKVILPRLRVFAALLVPAMAAACSGEFSTLDPAGLEADRVAVLFWVMLAGAFAIWIFVIVLCRSVVVRAPRENSERQARRLILWGGAVFPGVVVTALVVFGVGMMPELRRPADGPTIAVSGERFWWRIAYDVEGGPGVVRNLPAGGVPSANEIWLPVGRRTEILLSSPDVIHSFWIPAIAGKMDAIPGRVTRLVVEPTRTGVFAGACAEYCGDTHAQMRLRAVVVPEEDYAAHVAAQAEPAAVTEGPGPELFLRSGCGACHTVRGTPADGLVGPDLTHVGGRSTLAAAILPMSVETLADFIRSPQHLKPGVEMPGFGMLPEREIEIIAEWLGSLE